jgi:large-conductance mechanosensitive channel
MKWFSSIGIEVLLGRAAGKIVSFFRAMAMKPLVNTPTTVCGVEKNISHRKASTCNHDIFSKKML